MENLLISIFGEKCFFCGRNGRIICYGCESKIKLAKRGVCIKCQQPTVLGFTHTYCQKDSGNLPSQLCVIYDYGGFVAQVIKKSKYNPKRFALLRVLSTSAAKMASKLGFDFTGFTLVPIPISKARKKYRGFNQTELIAKAIAKEFGLTIDNSMLTRIRDTSKQFGLHRDERGQNIHGAFAVDKDPYARNLIRDAKFLLVDDICTTGSTLMEASSALYSAGAKDVRCFALSRKI